MAQCSGTLVVHGDGSPAACTEELEGRCCAGSGAEHTGPAIGCEDMLGRGGCEICAMESFTARDWRHAAHVAAVAARGRRCVAHAGARRARAVVVDDAGLFAELQQLLRTR
jgi:hypothetical protein